MRDRSRSWDRRQLPDGRNGVLAVCAGVLVVIAAAVILISGHDHHQPSHHTKAKVSRPVVLAPAPATSTPAITTTTSTSVAKAKHRSTVNRKRIAKQDPQDRHGTKAAKRAARALRSHRALQHVPYRVGNVEIRLTGARKNGKAVLTVTAPMVADGKAAYRRFLARYDDSGRAYRVRFVAARKKRRHG